MTVKHHALPVPCKSCPYRKDVPSGVWDTSEYEKLPEYDGGIVDQLQAGATGLFLCHQKNNALCSGWLGCHGPENLLAMRMHGEHVEPETFSYETKTPLFASGAEAAAHGVADIEQPSPKAQKVIERILIKKLGVMR